MGYFAIDLVRKYDSLPTINGLKDARSLLANTDDLYLDIFNHGKKGFDAYLASNLGHHRLNLREVLSDAESNGGLKRVLEGFDEFINKVAQEKKISR